MIPLNKFNNFNKFNVYKNQMMHYSSFDILPPKPPNSNIIYGLIALSSLYYLLKK
jgi:hypothetical protein